MENIPSTCDFRTYALSRAEEGLFRIHPVEAGTKKPQLIGYQRLATCDRTKLIRLAEKWPHANVAGIVPARLAILDIDPRHGGDNTLAELVHRNGPLERTVTVKTANGGAHYYFFLPPNMKLKSYNKLGPGLELLSNGWNILLPGSVGSNGKAYEYEVAPLECQVAPVPSWLLTLALEKQAKKTTAASTTSPYADRGELFSLPLVISKGERNRTLTSYAGSLRARGFDEDEIRTLLLETNTDRCRPPLKREEVEKIAQWIGTKQPGQAMGSLQEFAGLDNLEAVIRATPWSGHFGFNCRRVAESLLALMRETGKTAVEAGGRFLALRGGRSHTTVARCLRALSGREQKKAHSIPRLFDCRVTRLRPDFIKFNEKTARHEQFTHYYRIPVHIATLTQYSQPRDRGVVLSCVNVAMAHDTFRSKKGMSETRAVALGAIEGGEIGSAAKLVEATGLSLRTAQRCLTELRKEGLIKKPEGIWCRTTLTLDAVATRRGSAGATAAQRVQYERDRDNYAERLVDFLRADECREGNKGKRELTIVPAPERHPDTSPPDPVWDGVIAEGTIMHVEEEMHVAASFKSNRSRERMAA